MVEENVAVHTTQKPERTLYLFWLKNHNGQEPIVHAIRAPHPGAPPVGRVASAPRTPSARLGDRRRHRCIRLAFFQNIHHTHSVPLFTQYIDVWLQVLLITI